MIKGKWVWMPHAGHFIGGSECRFVLNTYVGGYIVSTVGEYPDPLKRSNDYQGKFMEIGLNRLYETMVFKAVKAEDKCCPYRIDVSTEKDFEGYMTAEQAVSGHMKLCNKWSKKS